MKIEASGISLTLGAKPILRDIDIALSAGEMVGLIGPNGAGKTTLLRVLTDLVTPDFGEVRYDGLTAKTLGRKELARRIAFLAQGGAVHWSMRAEALVGLGRLPHRQPFAGENEADRAAITRAMTAADATAFADRTVETLSGGERMRVLLARALAVEAPILLADEPLAALDPLHQLEVMELLHRTAAGGTGVAVILHDLTLAARFCDRLILLDRGKLIADGSPGTVLSDANLGAVFGITAARGSEAGAPYLLPWRRLTSDQSRHDSP